LIGGIGLVISLASWPGSATAQPGARAIETIPGMLPVVDSRNLYSETQAGKLSPAVAGALPRVYVPNLKSNDVYVIDPATRKVVDRFRVGVNPQHVVPSYDLKTLWVTNNAEGRTDGSLTPIDPMTGKPGKAIAVDDPYNMYFTPDGRSAIVVAEALKRLDFRDPERWRYRARSTSRNAAASTTPTSRSMAASRSSRASSREAWRRSTSRTGKSSDISGSPGAACPRTSASRRTARSSSWRI
jgi:YVTN family beta-propeller protein